MFYMAGASVKPDVCHAIHVEGPPISQLFIQRKIAPPLQSTIYTYTREWDTTHVQKAALHNSLI
jgi:hypothetical protein